MSSVPSVPSVPPVSSDPAAPVVPRQSVSRQSVSRQSVSRQSVSRQSVPRQSVPRQSVPRQSVSRQIIPRPAAYREGGPAPWADLSLARRQGIALDRVRRAVVARSRRSGGAAVDRVPERLLRSLSSLAVAGRPAAVLVPLFEEDGETRVVLTVRSEQLRSHRSEVAFPGGRLDPGEGVVAGALREADEEVGLDSGLLTVIGQLTTMPTASSGTLMTPVVATLEGRPALVASPDEVERVFDVALADLLADGVFHEEWWSVPGRPGRPGMSSRPGNEFPVWFFDVAGETVWGATARTLVELVCAVLELGDPLAF